MRHHRVSEGFPSTSAQAQPTLAFAVSSSHVSTVSQADRRSDSPNSYFFDHPRGAYRKRSWMMAWNQASRKYKRARSLGDWRGRLPAQGQREAAPFPPRGTAQSHVRPEALKRASHVLTLHRLNSRA